MNILSIFFHVFWLQNWAFAFSAAQVFGRLFCKTACDFSRGSTSRCSFSSFLTLCPVPFPTRIFFSIYLFTKYTQCLKSSPSCISLRLWIKICFEFQMFFSMHFLPSSLSPNCFYLSQLQCSSNFYTFDGGMGIKLKKHILKKITIVIANSYESIEIRLTIAGCTYISI